MSWITYNFCVAVATRSNLKKKLRLQSSDELGKNLMTNKFNDITNPELRTWNRCAMIFNLMKDKGVQHATKYAGSFSLSERNEISRMYERITRDGYEKTRAAINRNVQSATIAA